MSKQCYGKHWVEWLLRLSDGGIHWGALEDMYLEDSKSEDEQK